MTRSKPTKPKASEWAQEAIEYMHSTWTGRMAQSPSWTAGDYAAFYALLRRNTGLTADEVKWRWFAFLRSDDKFYRQRGYSLRYFCRIFDELLEPAAALRQRYGGNR